jgi:VanZ family protein
MRQPISSIKTDRNNQPVVRVGQPLVKRRFTSAVSRWIVPALWAAVILTLGTSLFSLVRTSAMFNPLISRMMPGIGSEAIYHLQVFVRRSAHVVEYAILFLVLNLGPLRGRPLVALFVCIGCASLDESLQMLTPSRSGTISDVAEDTSGATMMLVLAMPYWDRMRYNRQLASKS